MPRDKERDHKVNFPIVYPFLICLRKAQERRAPHLLLQAAVDRALAAIQRKEEDMINLTENQEEIEAEKEEILEIAREMIEEIPKEKRNPANQNQTSEKRGISQSHRIKEILEKDSERMRCRNSMKKQKKSWK